MGNQNYSIMMQSLNTDDLYTWAPALEQAIDREVPEVQDVSTDLEMKSPRINLVIDRDKAAVGRAERDPDRRTRSTTRSDRSGRRRSTANARSTACCSSSIRSTRGRPTR